MILVTGGAYQGKSAFIEKMWPYVAADAVEGDKAHFPELCEKACVYHFEKWVARAVQETMSSEVPFSEKELADLLCEDVDDFLGTNPDIVIELPEVGCGVIPIDKDDRLNREMCGRVGCHLAGKAESVYRIVMGMVQKIK